MARVSSFPPLPIPSQVPSVLWLQLEVELELTLQLELGSVGNVKIALKGLVKCSTWAWLSGGATSPCICLISQVLALALALPVPISRFPIPLPLRVQHICLTIMSGNYRIGRNLHYTLRKCCNAIGGCGKRRWGKSAGYFDTACVNTVQSFINSNNNNKQQQQQQT